MGSNSNDSSMPARQLAMRRLSTTLALGALTLLLYPFITLGWATFASRKLDDQFDSALRREQRQLPVANLRDQAAYLRKLPVLARAYRKRIQVGDPIARIEIRSIGLKSVVVQGSKKLAAKGVDDTLRDGPGHIFSTPLPGENSNSAFAGHRTTYTHPFWSLDSMKKGQRIIVTLPYGTFTYRVTSTVEVRPSEIGVIRGRGFEELTLSTCTPRFTATRRLIVHAKLFKVEPPEAAA